MVTLVCSKMNKGVKNCYGPSWFKLRFSVLIRHKMFIEHTRTFYFFGNKVVTASWMFYIRPSDNFIYYSCDFW